MVMTDNVFVRAGCTWQAFFTPLESDQKSAIKIALSAKSTQCSLDREKSLSNGSFEHKNYKVKNKDLD